VDVHQKHQQLLLEKGSLCFTYCQVPVVYTLAEENSLTTLLNNNTASTSNQLYLEASTSQSIFNRTGEVIQINVKIKASTLA
jgi:hypothetical protein